MPAAGPEVPEFVSDCLHDLLRAFPIGVAWVVTEVNPADSLKPFVRKDVREQVVERVTYVDAVGCHVRVLHYSVQFQIAIEPTLE